MSEYELDIGGYKVKVLKLPRGHRCGYITVPETHGYYGIDYAKSIDDDLAGPYSSMEVHGGITYSQFEDDGNYWIGFDCSHIGDNEPGGRSLEYCIAECLKMFQWLEKHKVRPFCAHCNRSY